MWQQQEWNINRRSIKAAHSVMFCTAELSSGRSEIADIDQMCGGDKKLPDEVWPNEAKRCHNYYMNYFCNNKEDD